MHKAARLFLAACLSLLLLRRRGWLSSTLLDFLATLAPARLLLAVLCLLSAAALYSTFLYPHVLSPLRRLPEPAGGHWLLGHGLDIDRIAEFENDGLIRVRWFFNREFVVLTSPAALSEVLVTKSYLFEKPRFLREYLAFALGWSVLTVEGDEHRRQRRNLMPAFAFRHVKDLYPLFWAKSREVTRAMTDACRAAGRADLHVDLWASRVTLDIIGLAGTGLDFGAVRDGDGPLTRSYQGFRPSPEDNMLIALRVFLPASLVAGLPLRKNRIVAASTRSLRRACEDMIRRKRRSLADDEPAARDILSVALASDTFSDESLVDQLLTMLSAGHETTSSALTWAVYMLCRFPTVQSRLRDEVRQSLPSVDDDAPVTSDVIDGLPYLNAVCCEVLRMCPPVAQTLRVATCDTTLQGRFVPRGTIVIMVPWANNLDPKLWGPDAHEFKPERWLVGPRASSGGASSNYAFMTFLHGPRSCIGSSFAKAEMACLLAAWVGRFSFELKDKSLMDERNVRVEPSVTAKPAGGLEVTVTVVKGY
ncbi:hypothetical protein RJ55_05262 [Drechmeria coniospora]|nr:hypothetical protein RJ55_05262 [Drechmeria coniospora]